MTAGPLARPPAGAAPRRAARRPDIDALRVLATLVLFPFHVGKIFDPAPFYHVRNGELSTAFLVFCGSIHLWHMPLFFVLAGWSIEASLRTRGPASFALERTRRLLVPLVAGTVLLCPLIKYLELRGGLDMSGRGLSVAPALQASFRGFVPGGLPAMAPFQESFVEFLPTFFRRVRRATWSHLWFVAYLLTFSLLYLPLLARWMRRAPAWLDRLATHRPRSILWAPILPLALVQTTLRPAWPGVPNLIDDWASFAWYSLYLLLGFALAREPRLQAEVHRSWLRALPAAAIATLVLARGLAGSALPEPVRLALTAVAGWCSVVALLGAAHATVRVSSPLLDRLARASFPVYVLHQPVIVALGFVVVGWPLGPWSKFWLLLATSMAVTGALVVRGVEPHAGPRFLLGMKPLA